MVDETADDLPVRDVGLMRGGLMPTIPGLCVDIFSMILVKKTNLLRRMIDMAILVVSFINFMNG